MFDAIAYLFADWWIWNTSSIMAIVCLVLTIVFWAIKEQFTDSEKDYYYHIFNVLMYISLIVFVVLFGRIILTDMANNRVIS